MTAIEVALAEKIAMSPAILNQAATPAIVSAVINVIIPKNIQLFI
jgi:hypothetical protein